MENKDSLMHYGVKGMKWGIVKDAGKNVAGTTKTAVEAANGLSNNTKRNRKAKSMTDEELRKKIARLELEQRYSNLNPGITSRGSAAASSALSAIGSMAAIAASVATVALAIKDWKEDNKPKYVAPDFKIIK